MQFDSIQKQISEEKQNSWKHELKDFTAETFYNSNYFQLTIFLFTMIEDAKTPNNFSQKCSLLETFPQFLINWIQKYILFKSKIVNWRTMEKWTETKTEMKENFFKERKLRTKF